MYLTFSKYTELSGKIKNEKAFNQLEAKKEYDVDILTFNRYRNCKDASEFEVSIIEQVMCDLIDFENDNSQMLNSFVSSYSINGVSVNFGDMNKNISIIQGVYIPASTYQKLCLTRFACRII